MDSIWNWRFGARERGQWWKRRVLPAKSGKLKSEQMRKIHSLLAWCCSPSEDKQCNGQKFTRKIPETRAEISSPHIHGWPGNSTHAKKERGQGKRAARKPTEKEQPRRLENWWQLWMHSHITQRPRKPYKLQGLSTISVHIIVWHIKLDRHRQSD